MVENGTTTVIIINEDSHGVLGVAKDYSSAVRWLIKQQWIGDLIVCWDDSANKWRPIEEALGKNWKEIIIDSWDTKKFNNFFEGFFYLETAEVIQ